MATLVENLQTQIAQIGALIVEITATANPTVTIAGRTVGKTEYLHELRESQKELMLQLQQADLLTNGLWEVRSYGA